VLAEKLRGSVKVKRLLQASEGAAQQSDIFASFYSESPVQAQSESQEPKLALQLDEQLHLEFAMEFYYNINLPIFGLMFFKQYESRYAVSSGSTLYRFLL